MRRQRHLLGLVLLIALCVAAWASPVRAARLAVDDGPSIARVEHLQGGTTPGWLQWAWSWLSAILAADNGQIIP
jgi:hypothetical protein